MRWAARPCCMPRRRQSAPGCRWARTVPGCLAVTLLTSMDAKTVREVGIWRAAQFTRGEAGEAGAKSGSGWRGGFRCRKPGNPQSVRPGFLIGGRRVCAQRAKAENRRKTIKPARRRREKRFVPERILSSSDGQFWRPQIHAQQRRKLWTKSRRLNLERISFVNSVNLSSHSLHE